MTKSLVDSLTALFERVGPAHHQAFLATDGADPDWAIWYADYLLDDMRALVGSELSRTTIVRCLVAAADEHAALASEIPWPRFYAEHFVERLAPAADSATDKLALYYYPSCPFCRRVQAVIEDLGLDVELRDILVTPEHRSALLEQRGRATVPVLRIEGADGDSRWMPESSDIMTYLRKTYG